jgi:hypothetical protein
MYDQCCQEVEFKPYNQSQSSCGVHSSRASAGLPPL